ncbi:MAG: hypothetical protein FWG63_05055 [Defluviitaleaceae bacterium]|nr:hypothetical protein [Defluviitaleaceae bacterium]
MKKKYKAIAVRFDVYLDFVEPEDLDNPKTTEIRSWHMTKSLKKGDEFLMCSSSTKDTYAFIFGLFVFDRAEKIGDDLYEWHFSEMTEVAPTPINRAGQGWFTIEADLDIWTKERCAELPDNVYSKAFEDRIDKKTGKLIPQEFKSSSKVGIVF